MVIPAKQSRYTLAQLLGSQALAAPFSGGWCLVFRLAVRHYHRYCFPDNGVIADYGFLPGVLHTVRPVALAGGRSFARTAVCIPFWRRCIWATRFSWRSARCWWGGS